MEKIKFYCFKLYVFIYHIDVFLEAKYIQKILVLSLNKYCFNFTKKLLFKILKENEEDFIFLNSGCGTLNLLTKKNFYKISLRKKNIKQEYENYNAIVKNNKIISQYCIPTYYIKKYVYILKSGAMQKNQSEIIQKDISLLLDTLKNSGRKEIKKINEKENKNIVIGLDIIRYLTNDIIYKKYRNIIINILNEEYQYGPCHGDFHKDNILKNDCGKIFMIDIDCYRENSLQAMDAFYYYIELLSRNYNRPYYYIAIDIFNGKIQVEDWILQYIDMDLQRIAFLYIFDRLGQEFKYFPPTYLISKNALIAMEENFKRFNI